MIGERWNAAEAERLAPSPADDVLPGAPYRWVRAVDVAAPAPLMWRWLCQLRAAPYSYDLVDNLGRRSPRRLTPGLEALAVGQRAMIVMEVASFAVGRHVTFRTASRSPRTPDLAMAYVLHPRGDAACRLVCHVLARPPRLPAAGALMRLLAAGDALMMRKQLRTLARLAARDAQRA